MKKLEPEALWGHFEAISRIPRGSGNEAAVGEHILTWAKGRGLKARRDGVGNILVEVPASRGREKVHPIVLQGHLDMVCEKNAGTEHDFEKHPIRLKVSGEYVIAEGTTLGADNGIGLAGAMAVAEDGKCAHGPLELLFTVDEETGLKGAQNLEPGFFRADRLLNLDTEEDGAIYIGCAGGVDTSLDLRVTRGKRAAAERPFVLTVSGLRGGHSGSDIHEGRGNANLLLARVLHEWEVRGIPFSLASIEGGSKRNAIPREATACLYLKPGAAKAATDAARDMEEVFRSELRGLDESVSIALSTGKVPLPPLSKASARKVLGLLHSLPHGVLGMSRDVPGLVETSTNLAIVKTHPGRIEILTSQRSSTASEKVRASRTVAAAGSLAGAKVEFSTGYPGWKPDLESPLLKTAVKVHKELFGKAPTTKAIHAGLECGLIGEKYPGLQMVSIGPTIENAHSPSERVHVPAVGRFYEYLKAILAELR